MGSLSLLQGIFPTQGLNPFLPHCRQILYQLSHEEIIRIKVIIFVVFFLFFIFRGFFWLFGCLVGIDMEIGFYFFFLFFYMLFIFCFIFWACIFFRKHF